MHPSGNLELQFNQLVGTVPESIYNLNLLSQLSLDHNQLTGTISSAVSNLGLVRILEYNNNGFTGNIPITLYSLPSLVTIRIGDNDMAGPLSELLSQLNLTLEEFSVPNNDFTGPFLSAFDALVNLSKWNTYLFSSEPPTNLIESNSSFSYTFLTTDDLVLHGTDLTGAVSLAVCERKGGSQIKNLTVPATVDCSATANCCDLILS